ncbi:MAG: hypothetical protein PHY48_04760 [Candidatus Cloacimonetes bacterium]|nr:hypothetical protein [Candidatus Cloacimonadota bacterium]
MIINKDTINSIKEETSQCLAREIGENYALLMGRVIPNIDNARADNRFFVVSIPINQIKTDGLDIEDLPQKTSHLLGRVKNCCYIEIDNHVDVIHTGDLVLMESDVHTMSTGEQDSIFIYFHERNDQTPSSYNVYFRGSVLKKTHVFDNPKDSQRYKQLISMSSIDHLFNKYQDSLNFALLNNLFFLTDREKNKEQKKTKNLLRRAPEELFKKHFIQFVRDNSSMQPLTEHQMIIEDKRCDVLLEESSKFVMIEIKWMGQSIGNPDKKNSYQYKIERVEDGIEQILRYLFIGQKELRDLNAGYLVVYDARVDKDVNHEKLQTYTKQHIDEHGYQVISDNYYEGYRIFNVNE